MILLFVSFIGLAHAQDIISPVKILGRGIRNEDTQEILQLACVGAPKGGDQESNCNELQFLYSALNQNSILIGEKIILDSLEPDFEKLKKTGLLRVLRDKVSAVEMQSFAKSDGDRFDELFPLTQSYGGRDTVLFAGMSYVGFAGVMAGPFIYSTYGRYLGSIIGFSILTIAYAPVILDLLALPFRAYSKSLLTNSFVESYRNINELSNRDLHFWQERAKEVSAAGFRQLFISIEPNDSKTLETVAEGCKATVEIIPDISWRTWVMHSQKNLTREGVHRHYRQTDEFKRPAVEDFIRRYSITFFNDKYSYATIPQLETDQYFKEIVEAHVRPKYFISENLDASGRTIDDPTSYKINITPYVKSIRKNSYVKKYCMRSNVFQNDICDAVPTILMAKLTKALPVCKSAIGLQKGAK